MVWAEGLAQAQVLAQVLVLSQVLAQALDLVEELDQELEVVVEEAVLSWVRLLNLLLHLLPRGDSLSYQDILYQHQLISFR